MPQSMEIFVKSTKTRIIFASVGLSLVWLAVMSQYWAVHQWHSNPDSPWVVLVGTLLCGYGGAFALTVGLWGGFPEWSHAFIPRGWRELFAHSYKEREAAQSDPVSPYKWGSRLQVRLVQWAMVPLVGWLATLSSTIVGILGGAARTGVIGACVGGILAIGLAQFLRR